MKPIFSICIPTYNRKERLLELINFIRKNNKNRIPVLVFDNASDDGTKEKLLQFISDKDIIYFRNEINLGHDSNYLKIIEKGACYAKYSLWLGDDDLILPEIFKDIPKMLECLNPDLLILNSYKYENDFFKRNKRKILARLGLYSLKKTLNINCDKEYNLISEFFTDCFDKMSFGTLVVNNELLDAGRAERYLGTYHLYSGAIWDMLDKQKQKMKAIVVAKPYVVWGKGDKTYNKIMDDVCRGMGKWYALLPNSLKEEVYAVVHKIKDENTYGEATRYIFDEYKATLKDDKPKMDEAFINIEK